MTFMSRLRTHSNLLESVAFSGFVALVVTLTVIFTVLDFIVPRTQDPFHHLGRKQAPAWDASPRGPSPGLQREDLTMPMTMTNPVEVERVKILEHRMEALERRFYDLEHIISPDLSTTSPSPSSTPPDSPTALSYLIPPNPPNAPFNPPRPPIPPPRPTIGPQIRRDVAQLRLPHNKLRQQVPIKVDAGHSFCVPWSVRTDEWWEEHPLWDAVYRLPSDQGPTQCFRAIEDPERRDVIQSVYDAQYRGDCSNAYVMYQFSSGFGIDTLSLAEGLFVGSKAGRPFVVRNETFDGMDAPEGTVKGWHYVVGKRPPFDEWCPRKDYTCYFLRLSKCPDTEGLELLGYDGILPEADHNHDGEGGYALPYTRWLRQHLLRPRQAFRKELYQYVAQVGAGLDQKCAVMHVRRGDVRVHGHHSRRYHAVSEYMDAAGNLADDQVRQIFLLTDDADAIDEAEQQYPQYQWVYIDRKRNRGEITDARQFESSNIVDKPKREVLALLAALEMAKRCDVLMFSKSNLADLLYEAMCGGPQGRCPTRVDIDYNRPNVESITNSVCPEVNLTPGAVCPETNGD